MLNDSKECINNISIQGLALSSNSVIFIKQQDCLSQLWKCIYLFVYLSEQLYYTWAKSMHMLNEPNDPNVLKKAYIQTNL